MKAYINLAIKNHITTYLANTHCATAPAITICWHDRINSEVQTKPIRYSHHIYRIHDGSISKNVNPKRKYIDTDTNNTIINTHSAVPPNSRTRWMYFLHHSLVLTLKHKYSRGVVSNAKTDTSNSTAKGFSLAGDSYLASQKISYMHGS